MNSKKIPKIIHQIWFQGKNKIPKKYILFQQKWKILHKNFKYKFWDEKKISNLIYKKYNFFYSIWIKLPYMIQKIDSAKIIILFSYGGVFVDMDMEPIMNIDSLLNASIIFSRCYLNPFVSYIIPLLPLKYFAKTHINNGFIACTKKHPVMLNTLNLMLYTIYSEPNYIFGIYIAATCGTEVLIKGFFKELEKNPKLSFKIYPSEYFEPKIKIKNKPVITNNTRIIHHTEKTWIKDNPISHIQTSVLILITIIIIIFIVLLTIYIINYYKIMIYSK